MKAKKIITKIEQNTEALLNDFDMVRESDTKTGTLLKSVSVPYALIGYQDSQMDILRTNQAFLSAFGGMDIKAYLRSKDNYKLMTALDEAVLSRNKSECECLFALQDNKDKWYQLHLVYIGVQDETNLISATFTDVTAVRKLEQEFNAVFAALRNADRRKASLLVIDDQEVSREIITALFEEEYEVLQAQNGQEGLAVLREKSGQIAAILLDMVMPKMDGKEFLFYKNKMQEAADIPVIVISSEKDEQVQIQMLENGVNDYVTKPFVPALMKRRLHNVLEYSSRFRTLVREYQNASALAIKEGGRINLTGYSIEQVKTMLHFMNQIFDLVRLVDPVETAVISIEENNQITRDAYSCFRIWGKQMRCEHCSSICALKGQCTLNKFELLKNAVFYVVSQPVEVYLEEGHSSQLVLEIASRVSDGSHAAGESAEAMWNALQNTQGLIYKDPLTDAYNRRYFDEMLFLYHGQNSVAQKVALIILDLYQFKQTNDIYGHLVGDKVLIEVVAALKKQIRESDSVVRYGGDEFVILLTDCEEQQVEQAIETFGRAIREVVYGLDNSISAEADFGYAYTGQFEQDGIMLSDMIRKADSMMYENKRKHREEDARRK